MSSVEILALSSTSKMRLLEKFADVFEAKMYHKYNDDI
jgi:hypothetical protein